MRELWEKKDRTQGQKIVRQVREIHLLSLLALHSFDDFQSGEFFTLFFFQCILNVFCKNGITWDGNIFQSVGTLLGFLILFASR